MKQVVSRELLGVCVLLVAGLFVWAGPANAYDQFSQNGGDATNCGLCHGNFRAGSYISPGDGQDWGNLHNLHRFDMLGGDCNTCHISSGRFPVLLNASVGGSGLATIGCVGCHGRAEDNTAANPDVPGLGGYGAGLRQHHTQAGVAACTICHQDADPAKYTPASETIQPPYYGSPFHPAMPTDACNPAGGEDFAGDSDGLDNDGNGQYDFSDVNCLSPVEETTWGAIKALYATE
ncbi:MAG: hypothetical protein V3V49_10870 [Candidatus Krumholzibacteria bacterium]